MPKSVFTSAYASFLKTLISARKQQGLSQEELAKRINKRQGFISAIERGERRLDVIEFCVLCNAMGIEPAALMAEIATQLPADTQT